MHRSRLLTHGDFATTKIPVADFQRLTKLERLTYLVEQAPRKPGAGSGLPYFEDLLEKVELSGTLDPELTRALIELQQIRNAFAHRRGIADARLLAACPWRTDLELGQQLKVDPQEYGRLTDAVQRYTIELMARTASQFGRDLFAEIEKQTSTSA